MEPDSDKPTKTVRLLTTTEVEVRADDEMEAICLARVAVDSSGDIEIQGTARARVRLIKPSVDGEEVME